jgi:transcriptional regulator with XRE-family HTH domain
VETDNRPEFAKMLEGFRVEKKFSMNELARRIDLNHSYISRLESGERNPARETINKLSDALGLTARQHDEFMDAAGFVSKRGFDSDAAQTVVALKSFLENPNIPANLRSIVLESVSMLIGAAIARVEKD